MEWLSQNWAWLIFVVGVFMLMRQGGMGCGMGLGHANDGPNPQTGGADRDQNTRPKDPVNGEFVNPETAVNSMYQGRVYYFASRENRDAFEGEPSKYASSEAARTVRHQHHHHGC
jgi:YHS domain-containing protein